MKRPSENQPLEVLAGLASAVAPKPNGAGTGIEKSSAQWVRLNCCRCKVIRSFTMKSGCRSSALAAASLSALGLYRRKITHTSTSIWAMPVASSAPIARRYSISIRVWAHMKLIRQIVLTVTWTELKKQPRFSRRYNGHSPCADFACCPIVRKAGGASACRSMQQHRGFPRDGTPETAGAHLPLHRRRGGR
jgi:hypothetical protein